MTNFAQEIAGAASEHPDQPAVKLDDTVLNYRLLDEATARAAGLLRSRGVGMDDRVGMPLPNVLYFGGVHPGGARGIRTAGWGCRAGARDRGARRR